MHHASTAAWLQTALPLPPTGIEERLQLLQKEGLTNPLLKASSCWDAFRCLPFCTPVLTFSPRLKIVMRNGCTPEQHSQLTAHGVRTFRSGLASLHLVMRSCFAP
jgi:hypothetical protein